MAGSLMWPVKVFILAPKQFHKAHILCFVEDLKKYWYVFAHTCREAQIVNCLWKLEAQPRFWSHVSTLLVLSGS